jgi:hypothetical protein
MIVRRRSTAHCISEAPLNEHSAKNGAAIHVVIGNRVERLRLLLTYRVFAGAAVGNRGSRPKIDRFCEAFVSLE